MKKLLVILGPTATGKTDLGIILAKKFNGEIIACDSRQVYQGLDIGTGKYPGKSENLKSRKAEGWWEIEGVKVWMYDLVKPNVQYTVYDYIQKANQVVDEIENRGKLPILVGGTGLYLKALLTGLDNLPPASPKLRQELELLSLKELQSRVATLSPTVWEDLSDSDKKNPRRLIRNIERVSMNPYTNKFKISNLKFKIPVLLKIGLTAPRPYLNSKINQRVFSWIADGIIDEVKKLLDSGVGGKRFKEFGLEYGLIVDYLEGRIPNQEALIGLIQTKVRQYAKRQMTWFKREKDVVWLDITAGNLSHRVESEVRNWYNQQDG